ncbi:MAG: LamG-like jellyroll fold domain-containing protein, partial [Bacteroidota bacterium]
MTKIFTGRLLASLFLVCLSLPALYSQAQDPFCNQSPFGGIMPSSAFFNYGNSTKMKSSTRKMKLTIGQLAVGSARNNKNACNFGYWGQFLVPPRPPFVIASQGELLDRIQISWSPNPLGPYPVNGFKIFRDGVFLAAVDSKTTNYNDFNVIAGKPYTYTVKGLNVYGEGSPGSALGFQVPNGVVTGQIQTINGSPVPNGIVTLMPMQGFSAKFGDTDGALSSLDSNKSFLPIGNADWSITCWIKTESAPAGAGILQLGNFPLYIRALDSGSGSEGVAVSEDGVTNILSAAFPDTTKNGWHHIALTYSAQFGRLYIDGVLKAISPMTEIPSASDLTLGSRTNFSGWKGRLDELRIYHRRLDEIDLGEVMEGTASSTTPGLKYYWKMDEQRGTKSFDLIKRTKIYFCGVQFDTDRPPVRTSGKSDENGFYRIESASYGTGLTFLAEPAKFFYMHRALKFERAHEDYALLPDFSLTPKSTLELWVNSAGPDGTQCVFSKKWQNNDFRLMLAPNGLTNELKVYLNGAETPLGDLGAGYQHLAFTIDSTAAGRVITAYKNGMLISANTFSGITGNWSDTLQQWVVGARQDGTSKVDYFGGLVDEIAVYDTTLSQTQIMQHVNKARDPQEKGLRVYFAMDEGSGIRLSNAGSLLTPYGSILGASWIPFSPNQKTEPHEFLPRSRQVTLNPSVTSVDQVDFVDRSTIAVTGYVRYKNTDCFAEKVEILVNGASFSPAIFTDSVGRFVIDLDPGATVTLTPKFENHVFIPAFWDVSSISSPIAGILFNDVTTRKITGVIAGGNCKQEIIENPALPTGTVCIVKVRSKNGCLERQQTVKNEAGNYTFNNLPPVELTVSIVEFSDPVIKNSFQTSGGKTVDLSKRDTVLDFIYFAPP